MSDKPILTLLQYIIDTWEDKTGYSPRSIKLERKLYLDYCRSVGGLPGSGYVVTYSGIPLYQLVSDVYPFIIEPGKKPEPKPRSIADLI